MPQANFDPQALLYPGNAGMPHFQPGGVSFSPLRDVPTSPYWLGSPGRGTANPLGRTAPAPYQHAMADVPIMDVLRMAVQNVPSSIHGVLSNFNYPFYHPIEFSENLGKLAVGAVQKAIPGRQSYEAYPELVMETLKQRYGGKGQLKETLATDPVGLLTEVAGVLGPGLASLPGRLGAKAGAAVNATDITRAPQAALKGAVSSISNLKNKIDPNARKLMEEGITPTMGQTFGGTPGRWEEKASSIPVLGDVINNARGRAAESFNMAAFQRALAPIGESTEGLKPGATGLREVRNKISDKYEALLPQLKISGDDDFFGGIKGVLNKYGNVLEKKKGKQLNAIVDSKVVDHFIKDGDLTEIDGKKLKHLVTELRVTKRKFEGRSGSDSLMADAFDEIDNLIQQQLVKDNPKSAAELKNIDASWAHYKVLEKAGSKAGATGEQGFSPAQLANAVKDIDTSIAKGRTATGEALYADLAQAAKETLGPNVPDSGTAGRGLLASALLGGTAVASPATGATILAGSLPYTRPGQNVLSRLATEGFSPVEGMNRALQVAPNIGPAAFLAGRTSEDWLNPEEHTERMQNPRMNLQESLLQRLLENRR